tara:strand:+ start:2099 stop:2347 length:249 start_codon:yes stop_codon:yes gene_type:complete
MTIHTSDDKQESKETRKIKPLSLIQTIKSVLWAMLGIQSKENLMRDFAHGKASNFIITGLLLVTFFVFALIIIVNVVLHLAL